jgi:hypothetical protein
VSQQLAEQHVFSVLQQQLLLPLQQAHVHACAQLEQQRQPGA